MLTNYKKNCEELIKGRLESATRYKFDNLQLENYKDFIVEFNIEVVNAFGVSKTERRVSGGNKRGELYYNPSEYATAIANHRANENNDENFQLLVSNIQNGSYAKYTETSTFKHGATILCEYNCGQCNGKGEVRCDYCRGKGEIRCNQCSGKGEVRCSSCGGSGKYKCQSCFGKGFYHQGISCGSCRGTGTRDCYECKRTGWLRCSSCSGNGYKTCYKCKGRTILICGSCDGSGSVTDIAEICIQTTPKYNIIYPSNTSEQIKDIIQSNMIVGIKNIANINRVDIQIDNENKKVIEVYKIQVPFASFNLTFNDKQFDYIIYGKNLQIAKWHDDIVPTILANDLKVIAKIAKESSIFDKKILQKSQVAVANFMESQINQNIIEADSKVDNEKYKKIDDRVSQIQNSFESKSVSDEYVKQTIASLYKIANDFCIAIRIRYLSLVFVIGFVASFCFGWYGIFATMVVFYVGYIINVITEKAGVKKYWGDNLTAWVEKRGIFIIRSNNKNNKDEVDNKKLSLGFGVLFAVYIAVFLTNIYVISFDEIKSKVTNWTQSIKSSQSKQTQPTQTQPKQQQPTTDMIRCDDSGLLKHLIQSYKNGLIDANKTDLDTFAEWREGYRQHGINIASAEEFVNSRKYNIINVRTKSSDEVNKRVECEVEIEQIFPIPQSNPHKSYHIIDYRARIANDNGVEFGIIDTRNVDE